MLTINCGTKQRYCDGVSRRSFLQVGAMGLGGLTLAGLLRAEAAAGTGSSQKAIINIHLGGGPSHQDMFDLKPYAPREFRGEFNPIKTNVSGIEICEHLPLLAQMADKYAIIRSLVGMHDDHSNFHTQTGWGRNDCGTSADGRASARSSPNCRAGRRAALRRTSPTTRDTKGYLGPTYKAYRPQGGDLQARRRHDRRPAQRTDQSALFARQNPPRRRR